MGRLDGKVCVITGAGGGMGREAAILFSEEGASVCAADVNLEAAEETVSMTRDAFAQQVDVADEARHRGLEQRERLLAQVVALPRLFAVREQPDAGLREVPP